MNAIFRWIVERRLLTLAGFGVVLLGAFIPWPSLAIAAVVILVGAVLLAIQIPMAMRDATEQLDGVNETGEQWQAPAYPQYQPEPSQHPTASQHPEPFRPVFAPTPVWQPKHSAQSLQPEPSPQPGPSRRLDEPAPPWRPENIPPYRPEP